MERLRSWRIGVSAIFVVMFVGVVLAYSSYVYPTNDNGRVGGYAYEADCCRWPYIELKVDGLTGWLASPPAWYSGGIPGAGKITEVSVETSESSCGRFTARANFWADNEFVEGKSSTRDYNDCGSGACDPYDPDCPDTPIVIPTGNSQAIRLTSAADGVVFDIRGIGAPAQIAWTVADSEVAFLALDRNGNGVIDSGKELFGNSMLPNAGNGFAALRLTEGVNDDGAVDAADPLFAKLVLWTDRNHNGYSEAGELQPVSEVLEAIGLGYSYAERRDGNGNEFMFRGWARKAQRTGPQSGQVSAENIVWGTSAAQSEVEREFKIYDVILKTAQ
jgi:hypothetical protein